MRIPASSVPLEIRLLGPLEVLRDGVPVALPGRRERSVLALLASNAGEPVSVDRLYRFLWGDDGPRTADKTLQTYVSRLRRLLGDGDLVTRREAGYVLAVPHDAVDAARFRDLVRQGRDRQRGGDNEGALVCYRRALDEWRGDQPAAAPDTPEAMAWRQGLAAGRLDALEAAMALMVRGGRHQEAAAELEQLVVREPFRDELWTLLMEALDLGGRPAEALDAYQRARRRLSDELGLDPSPRLQRLQQRIIAQQADPVAERQVRPRRDPDADPQVTPRRDPAVPRRRGLVPPPMALTPLIGRDADRSRLAGELARSRLVTVAGTGGVGKTRLVLEVASGWPSPVAFCDLAVVREPEAVGHALAAAVGVDPEPGGDPVDAAAAALGQRELLVVVDNCEHLVRHVRHALHVVLSRCPRLTVVATSRQALRMEGEVVVALGALPVGDDGGDAALLFVDRARRAGADGMDDTWSRALVRSICVALDGLPLAIELAAAMSSVLTLDDLSRNLDDRFTLLQEPRLLAGRERTLRGTVEWSYQLLDPPAQRLLCRVSVFAGGFTSDAVARVCADEHPDGVHHDADGFGAQAVARLLAGLAERSLLERLDGGDQTRYRMLQTVREYCRDVMDPDEAAAASRGHARWAIELAERLAAERFGPQEALIVESFDRAVDDLRVAMRWSLRTGDAQAALRMVAATHLYAFFSVRSELFTWAIEAADRFRDSGHELLGEAIGSAVTWQNLRGDAAGAARNAALLRAIRERGGPVGPRALNASASLAARAGDFAAAYRHVDELYRIEPRIAAIAEGDVIVVERYAGRVESSSRRGADLMERMLATDAPSLQAFALIGSAATAGTDDPDAALARLRRAVARSREVYSLITERIAMSAIAELAALASDPVDALGALADAVGAWRHDGMWRMEWGTLRSLMELLARSGRHHELLVLDAAAQASATAPPLMGDQRERLAAAVAGAAEALGADGAAAAQAQGRAMSDERAVAFARDLLGARDGGPAPSAVGHPRVAGPGMSG